MTTDKLKEPFELLDEEAKEFCMKHWDCEIIDSMSSASYDIYVYEETTADGYDIWVCEDGSGNCHVNQHVHMYKDSLDGPILDVLRSGGTLKINDNDLYDFEDTIIDWQELYANLYEELTEHNNDEDKN